MNENSRETQQNSRDGEGNTSLHIAALTDDNSKINEIISNSMDHINAKNESGDTPLHLAAMMGHDQAAVTLAMNGSDVRAINDYGKTPLSLARSDLRKKLVAFHKSDNYATRVEGRRTREGNSSIIEK